jgi:hypothetical protein
MADDADQTDAAHATELLKQFKLDVFRLAMRPAYEPWPQVVITGLLDMAVVLMRLGLQAEPEALPILQAQVDRVRASVTPIEIPAGSGH